MKKKFLFGVAIMAIATIALANIGLNSQKNLMQDGVLANIEGLAGETHDKCPGCDSGCNGNSCCYLYISSTNQGYVLRKCD